MCVGLRLRRKKERTRKDSHVYHHLSMCIVKTMTAELCVNIIKMPNHKALILRHSSEHPEENLLSKRD